MPQIELSGYHVLNTHGASERGTLLVEGEGDLWQLVDYDHEIIFEEADCWPSEDYIDEWHNKKNIIAVGVVTDRDEGIFVIDERSVQQLIDRSWVTA